MASSGILQPGMPDPNQGQSPEEKKRRADIIARRASNITKVSASNTKNRAAALKKKGNQTYEHSSIQGNTDFGGGAGGPGVPWSIKTQKVKEKQKSPDAKKVPKFATSTYSLWPTPGNLDSTRGKPVDLKVQAIRRRLNNG